MLTIVPDICREWEASFKGFNPESSKSNLVEHLKESNGFSGLEINPCHILCLHVFVCVCLFIAISICPTSFLSVWAKFLWMFLKIKGGGNPYWTVALPEKAVE